MKTNMRPYEEYKNRHIEQSRDIYLADLRKQVRDKMERIDEVHVTDNYVEFIGLYYEDGRHYEVVRVNNNASIDCR